MSILQNKIDFAVVISVENANPNGDPLDGNRPRTTFDGRGEMSDVCLKRKIRNRLQDEGHKILVQSDDKKAKGDEYQSIRERVDSIESLCKMNKLKKKRSKKEGWDEELYRAIACNEWFDVRAFGQVFAFEKPEKNCDGTSLGVRGPVTIQSAYSTEPISISSMQITKSCTLELSNTESDTMGTKHRVDKAIYVSKGAINVQLAEKTGFTEEDAEEIKKALLTLFRNDCSSARPEGSMEVKKLIWWKHNCKNGQYSSAVVHRSLRVSQDGEVELGHLEGLVPEILEGE